MMAFDVRRFDIYRKVPKDLTQPTVTGAIISISCTIFMILLIFSEGMHFLKGEIVSDLIVESRSESDSDKIPVYIKVTLPKLKCEYVGLDIQDEMGRHEVGFVDRTKKLPVNEDGCLFEANFVINRVPGNFHISTHSASDQPENIDFSHIIHELRFGDNVTNPEVPGTYNPIHETKKEDNSLTSYDYIMKIVPSTFVDSSGEKLVSYQYSYASRTYISMGHGGRIVPALWFRYDLSPITVRYYHRRAPMYTFLTTMCAVVGGTFTVAGIIDSCIFTASEIFKKFELGKQS